MCEWTYLSTVDLVKIMNIDQTDETSNEYIDIVENQEKCQVTSLKHVAFNQESTIHGTIHSDV